MALFWTPESLRAPWRQLTWISSLSMSRSSLLCLYWCRTFIGARAHFKYLEMQSSWILIHLLWSMIFACFRSLRSPFGGLHLQIPWIIDLFNIDNIICVGTRITSSHPKFWPPKTLTQVDYDWVCLNWVFILVLSIVHLTQLVAYLIKSFSQLLVPQMHQPFQFTPALLALSKYFFASFSYLGCTEFVDSLLVSSFLHTCIFH